MKIRHILIGALLATTTGGSAVAGVFADDLGRCAAGATTQADRTALIRWIFVVAAANPAIRDLASVTDAQRDQAQRDSASVFARILLHACRRQAVDALRNEGAAGIEAGFNTLGQLAGREMMTTPTGAAGVERMVDLMDQADLQALGREATQPAPAQPATPH